MTKLSVDEKVELILTQLCNEHSCGECESHGEDAVLVAFNHDTNADICCRDCLGEALYGWFKHIEGIEGGANGC